jgi:hypothetical protein
MNDQPAPLNPTDAAELLRATGVALREELTALPEEAARWHPAEGEWCIKETLGHLIETERRGFAGRIRTLLAEDEPQLTGWDPAAVARARHDCDRELAELLREFSEERRASVILVLGLRDADLQHGGHHPQVGYLRVGDLLHEWIHHDRNHIRQMHAAVQAYVWPYMGNTQRFSQPA